MIWEFLHTNRDQIWRTALEVSVIALIIFLILRFLRGTRGLGVLKGLIFGLGLAFVLLLYASERLELAILQYLARNLLAGSLLVFAIVFQPEIRRGLIRLGQNPGLNLFARAEQRAIQEIVRATSVLAKKHIGALIAIQRDVGIGSFVETAVVLDAEVTMELLTAVFWPGSPLHDGAAIIRDQRLAAAGCLFPLTENPQVARSYGTRHRAAIGLTEESDAVCIVVSEETGHISVCEAGKIVESVSSEELKKMLTNLLARRGSFRSEEESGENTEGAES